VRYHIYYFSTYCLHCRRKGHKAEPQKVRRDKIGPLCWQYVTPQIKSGYHSNLLSSQIASNIITPSAAWLYIKTIW